MNKLLRKKNHITKKKKGFTLVELIIVIAIIAILAAVAIPKFGAIRDNANSKADLATAKNIATVVSAELANGNIKDNQGPVDPDGLTDSTGTAVKVTDQIDGGIAAKASSHTGFEVSINDGNIIVYYEDGKTIVYPVS